MSVSEKKPRSTTRLVAAGPGALTAVLLVGAVAFGASSLRGPSTADTAGSAATPPASKAAEPAVDLEIAWGEEKEDALPKDRLPAPKEEPKAEEPKEEPKAEEPKEEPKAEEPKEEPKAEQPKEQPKAEEPKQEPTPTEKPVPSTPAALALEGWTKETKVKLGWTPYGGDGFAYYKVVRGADANVTWPAGGDDTLIGAIGDRKATWWADVPSCGTPWTYRVFAVRHGDAGYVTLAASNAVTLSVTCAPEPTPVVVAPLGFELTATAGEGIALAWEACTSEDFAAYKVVRSKTNPDPRYPLNDGTELIGVIGDPGQTTFVDANVVAGETWTYRVVAVASGPEGHVVIGQTAALSATAQ